MHHGKHEKAEVQYGRCTDCPAAGASRRAFLRDVGVLVATFFGASALPSPARALVNTVTEIRPVGARGREHSYALPPGDSISIDVDNDVILARWQNRVYAFSLRCPHRGTRLQWHADERRIFCPKHKARFLSDGSHDSGRRSRDLDRYRIARQGDGIVVDLGAVLREDTDPDAWAAAVLVV